MTVRVRFAPSPTGEMHIGNVRTILYNYLFAKQNGGVVILRVEDTDQERFDPKALDSIYQGLPWVGITWDEGPREGGPHAPYVQSERLPIFQEHARRLVESGDAYPCFCSKERLDAMRAAQQARKEITRYDGLCRKIDPKEAAERASRESHVIRLKVPDEGTIALEDLVHGHVEWPLASIEDQILLKSDGFPTYQLAVIVDDHLMGVTHVLRADEWLPSTPKHLLVYRAFGWTPPRHGHVPVVLGADGKKLSKRHGATALGEFREQGFLPEALVNYLALVGWAPGTEDEIFSMDDLIERWRIDQVQKAGGKWDYERLKWFNGVWIRKLSPDELCERLLPFLPADWDRAVVRAAVPHIQERIHTLSEARDMIAFLFDEPALDAASLLPKKRTADETRAALTRIRRAIAASGSFEHAPIEAALKGVAEAAGWKQGDVNMAARLAVLGGPVGPPIYESLALLGRDRTLQRLDRAVATLSG